MQQQCCDYTGDPDTFVSKPCIPSVREDLVFKRVPVTQESNPVFKRGPSHSLLSMSAWPVLWHAVLVLIAHKVGWQRGSTYVLINFKCQPSNSDIFTKTWLSPRNDTQRILQRLCPSPHCKAAFSATASPAAAPGDKSNAIHPGAEEFFLWHKAQFTLSQIFFPLFSPFVSHCLSPLYSV